MKLSDIQTKKIIDVVNGTNIGFIADLNINQDGKIESMVIDPGKSFWSLNKDISMLIPWENITKIGEDVILVKRNT